MRKVYILPNLITTANMFCGFNAIIAAINGRFMNSAWLIMVSMVFDMMDGRVARRLRATSKFGVEYDSFSDLISFGIAPAMVAYLWSLQLMGRPGWLVAFLYLACAAMRLARFNIMTDVVPKNYFQGLPSPVAASGIATAIIFTNDMKWDQPSHLVMLLLLLMLGSLMISTVRFPSFKEFKVKRENAGGILALLVMTLVIIAIKPEIALFVFTYLYIGLGFIVGTYRMIFSKDEKVAATKPAEGAKS